MAAHSDSLKTCVVYSADDVLSACVRNRLDRFHIEIIYRSNTEVHEGDIEKTVQSFDVLYLRKQWKSKCVAFQWMQIRPVNFHITKSLWLHAAPPGMNSASLAAAGSLTFSC